MNKYESDHLLNILIYDTFSNALLLYIFFIYSIHIVYKQLCIYYSLSTIVGAEKVKINKSTLFNT